MDEVKISLLTITDGEDKSSPLANRIRKNYRHLRKWAKRKETDCFRIYDGEIKQYPLAIDFYAARFCVHYFSPNRERIAKPQFGAKSALCEQDPDSAQIAYSKSSMSICAETGPAQKSSNLACKANFATSSRAEPPEELVVEVEGILNAVFGAGPEVIFWRTRVKREKDEQYEKAARSGDFFTAFEYGAAFKINLRDYLDTGLFLDHRETRQIIAKLSAGKRVLNLFAYTCSFSVHAALAGASFTKSVDMSNTYLDWGRDNFVLNALSLKNNQQVRADCLKFLEEEREKYDIIIIDPPTISRSKKMDRMFDIQKDYIFLLSKALKLLAKEGSIFFSTNSRRFVFDKSQFPSCTVVDITHKTLPLDFHDPKIHRCWRLDLC